MNLGTKVVPQRAKLAALVLLSMGCAFGLLETCDDKLINLTRYVDPCGTLLNCPPGSFQTNAADLGDGCIDPGCTLPGGCGDEQPLGTIYEIDRCGR